MGKEKEKEKEEGIENGNGKGKRAGRVQIRRMENPIRRQITFSKRKTGLLKKAAELSLLCDVDVALIISSPSGKLFHSPAPNTDRTLERYQKFWAASNYPTQASQSIELVHLELENARKLKAKLEITQKHITGGDLDSLSFKELQHLEQKLEIAACKIRSRKQKLIEEYIGSLRKKVRFGACPCLCEVSFEGGTLYTAIRNFHSQAGKGSKRWGRRSHKCLSGCHIRLSTARAI